MGAITAGTALAILQYSYYLVVGAIGWGIVLVTTGLIVYEIRKIKHEDRKKDA